MESSSRNTQNGFAALLSTDEKAREGERVWPVAICSFIACLASLLTGLMLSFSSPTLAELAAEPNPSRRILANQTAGSLFAVSEGFYFLAIYSETSRYLVPLYALVKLMPHLPPTGDRWGLD